MLTRRLSIVIVSTDNRRISSVLRVSALGLQADRGRSASPRKKAEAQGLIRLTGMTECDIFNVLGRKPYKLACKPSSCKMEALFGKPAPNPDAYLEVPHRRHLSGVPCRLNYDVSCA